MTEYAVIYNAETGAPIGNYSGLEGTSARQQIPVGAAYMLVPFEAWTFPPNLEVIRAHLCAQVDAQAEVKRGRNSTLGSGQARAYQRKEAEARAWAADHGAATPYLAAEAAAAGRTVEQVAAAVLARVDAVDLADVKIEALRVGAKQRIAAAENLAALQAAAAVAWGADQ
jgi:hypothetical protein